MYRGKIQSERQARLDGNIVSADYSLRQMTHLELVLELGDSRADDLIALARASDGEGQRDVSAWSERLHEERMKVWAAAGEPDRPPLVFRERLLDGCEPSGNHAKARTAARAEAKRMLAQGQALWEATATEKAWVRWVEG